MSAGIRFSYFFSVSLAFAALNVAILIATFRLKRDDEYLPTQTGEELQAMPRTQEDFFGSSSAQMQRETSVEAGDASLPHTPHVSQTPLLASHEVAGLWEVLSVRTVLVMSFFLMLYCVSLDLCRSPTSLRKLTHCLYRVLKWPSE